MREVKIVPVNLGTVTVYVKEMLAIDRRNVKKYATDGKTLDEDKYEVALVGKCLCDENGHPLYTEDQYQDIEHNYTVKEYDKIISALTKLNILDETIDDIAGK